jgi:hypothetical protein
VELQLCSDRFLFLRRPDGGQNEIYVLLRAGSVRNDAVVVQIANHGKVQYTLSRFDVRNIRNPLLVRPIRMEIPIQKIWVTMQTFSVIAVFSASHLRQKIIFLHDPQNCFWIAVNPAFFKPNTHSSVPISAFGTRLTFPDLFCKIQIFCRQLHSADKSVITASGNPEKAAHFTDSVFFSVAVNNPIF